MTVKQLLSIAENLPVEKDFVDWQEMLEKEFDIHEYIKADPDIINFKYLHHWVCTDTRVGIRVWYFDDFPVCISFKPYRKSGELFMWRSNMFYKRVLDYARSLLQDPDTFDKWSDEAITNIVSKIKDIDYKKFEVNHLIETEQKQ